MNSQLKYEIGGDKFYKNLCNGTLDVLFTPFLFEKLFVLHIHSFDMVDEPIFKLVSTKIFEIKQFRARTQFISCFLIKKGDNMFIVS